MYARWLLPPIPPHKSNFHQMVSMKDFYPIRLHLEEFLPIVCKLQ